MAKYHITPRGEVKLCNAKVHCRYGDYNPHFDDPETAQLFADNCFDRLKFDSTIRTLDTSGFDLRMKNKNSLPSRVKDITGVKQRGFDYECYMSSCYAESLGLRNVLVQDKNGSWHAINQNGALPNVDEEKMKNLISNARASLEGAYDIANETNSEKFCRAIYYSDESDSMFIQTGAPELLDAAVVENGDTQLLEIKKTHSSGAQTFERTLGIGHDSTFELRDEDYDTLHPEILAQVEQFRNDNTTNQYNLKVNNFVATEQFVRDYQRSGSSEFVCTDKRGRAISIDMTRPPETVAKELVSNGFVTTLKIRTNLNTRKLDSNAIYRLRENKDKIYTGDYVKVPGGHRAIPFENFDKSKMTKVRNKVRIGEYLLPVKWEDKDSYTGPITLDKMEYFAPVMGGDIKKVRDEEY